jgi:hypothetical protein
VEIARDVCARRLLGVDQSARELANPVVARLDRGLACKDRLFGPTSSGSLQQQSRDRQQLRGDHHDRSNDVRTVGFPHGRREEEDL